MSLLANRIAVLPPEKRLLLTLRQSGAHAASGEEPSRGLPQSAPFSLVTPADRAILPPGLVDAYPLGKVQLGMLYHMSADVGVSTPAYHNAAMMHLDLPHFSLPALQRAVDHVVARHPIFRTAFDLTSFSEPLQLVYAQAALTVYYEDLRYLPRVEQEAVCQRFVARKNFELIDITHAPMIEFYVHQLSTTTITLTLIEPHAISDGWSTHLTLVELLSYHHAVVHDEPLPSATSLAVTYRDFIALERQALDSPEHRQFWIDQLHDATPTRLPRCPRAFLDNAGWTDHKLYMRVPLQVTAALQRYARDRGVPLKDVLLAAHLKVLSLATGQRDLTVGVTFNGRPEVADGTEVRGLFLNTLPLRHRLADGTWSELIRQVYAAETAILPYRRYPLAQIQREIGARAQVEVMFSYHHFHSIRTMSESGKLNSLEVVTDLSRTNFPLEVTFHLSAEVAGQLTLLMDYDVTQFSHAQVLALRETYGRVLAALSRDPDTLHTTVSALSPEEWQRVVSTWNATTVDYAEDRPIHDLIAAQAVRTPNAIAVVYQDERISYETLDGRANQLAHALRQCSVGPEVLVGVCCERSVDLVVALLGVLKAGGAYVPLDPSYPDERLRFMLNDAVVPVLLTQARFKLHLSDTSATVICLDDDWPMIAQQATTPLASMVTADNAAYMIYTSGSTGHPKGVINTHGAILNRLLWMQQTYRLDATDRVLQKTPASFDVSIWEFFWPLLTGARLVLARPEGHKDAHYLASLINEHGITTVHFVPSLLRLFVEEPLVEHCTSLRRVICSGEALNVDLQQQFFTHNTAGLYNLYGPTEAAVDVTAWPCQRDGPAEAVPIGRPIANTQIYVLDSQLQPVPVGVAGELYIGGAQLARGYHRRPALTAEKFTPDPFSATLGARLYRSGDLARFWPDGVIEFLGRIDQQIKLHGSRIELGEIEAALMQHPAVRDVVVVSRADTLGNQRLVAYAVSPSAQPPMTTDLFSFLRHTLPGYMVPSTFVFLEALPLTPSGKVDRTALPNPGKDRPVTDTVFVSPRTPIEEVLAEVWRHVLGIEKISVYDDFFALGGDSLLGLQIASKIRTAFAIQFPMPRLFEVPTIAGLSLTILQRLAEQADAEVLADLLADIEQTP